MKTTILAAFAALFVVGTTAIAAVTIENMGGASLPRFVDGNPALTGQSWTSASNNRMTQILSRSNATVGFGRSIAVRQDGFGDYTGLVTTNFNSWKAIAETVPPAPSTEWGNQHFQGIWIHGDEFVPADYSVTRQWKIWNSTTLAWENFSTPDTTTLNTSNNFRVRYGVGVDGQPGTSDDVPLASQNMSLPTRSFIYGGIGMSLGAGGSETNQQKIQNTLDYMRSKHLAAEIVVKHVPTNTVAKVIWVGEFSTIASPVLSATHTDTTVTLNWTDVAGELAYRIEQLSNNGLSWTQISVQPSNTTTYTVTGLIPGKQYSFRVTAVASGSEGVSVPKTETTSVQLKPESLSFGTGGSSILNVSGFGPATTPEHVRSRLEVSTDLVNWSSAPTGTTVEGLVPIGTTDGGLTTILGWKVTVPGPMVNRCFFRFRPEAAG